MIPIVLTAARAHAQAAEPFPVVPLEPPASRRHTWAYVTLAGGATFVGLSFAFSGKDKSGAAQAFQGLIVFGKKVYHFQVAAPTEEEAAALAKVAEAVKD